MVDTSIRTPMTKNQEAKIQAGISTVNAEIQAGKNRQWLNNYVGKRHLGELKYDDHDQIVQPGNKHIWTSTVQIGEIPYGQGEASTKGGARELAAEEALAALKAQRGPDDHEHHD
ncbi:hypothetical protein JOM56_000971 [Amanita muscaria]